MSKEKIMKCNYQDYSGFDCDNEALPNHCQCLRHTNKETLLKEEIDKLKKEVDDLSIERNDVRNLMDIIYSEPLLDWVEKSGYEEGDGGIDHAKAMAALIAQALQGKQ